MTQITVVQETDTTEKDVLVYKLMESCFTGLTSRMMFDFAISAGSKQNEKKKE